MRTISRESVKLGHLCPVRVHPFINHGGYPPHGHEFHEICLITGGMARHYSAGKEIPLHKGSVIVIAPGQTHGFLEPRKLCGINCYYLAPWLLAEPMVSREQRLVQLFLGMLLFPERQSAEAYFFELSTPACNSAVSLLGQITREYATESPSLFAIKLLFLKFLHELSREAGEPSEGIFANARMEVSTVIDEVECCVRENRTFCVETIAHRISCSAGHLHRIFTQACGTSPMAYYQRRRMQHAANLILNPNTSMTEIAHRIGCADSAHFSRTFRKQTGMSPREYRSKHLL